MDIRKYYGQLIGSKIVGFEFEEDEYGGDPFPVLYIEQGGVLYVMVVQQDAEGNGAGFLALEHAVKATENA